MHKTPLSYNELVEYARTHPSLNPLLRYGGIEGGSTVKLEDRGVNHFKRHDSASGVNKVNHYMIET